MTPMGLSIRLVRRRLTCNSRGGLHRASPLGFAIREDSGPLRFLQVRGNDALPLVQWPPVRFFALGKFRSRPRTYAGEFATGLYSVETIREQVPKIGAMHLFRAMRYH